MIARLKNRLHRRDGQSLIMFAIALPLMLLFVGFVVDASHAFVDYRHLQNTADASALAAAQDIKAGTCPTCSSTATSYVIQNGLVPPSVGLKHCTTVSTPYPPPDSGFDESTTCYQWPYVDSAGVSHPDEVLVKLRNCTSTFFGGIVGVPSICESVRSVARATPLTSSSVTPGTTIDGVTLPGTTIQGTTIAGTTTPGTTIAGTTNAGTTNAGTTNPGTTVGPTTVYTTSTLGSASGGVGFAMSQSCQPPTAAITYAGAGGGTIGSLETNGGISIGNNAIVNRLAWGKRGTSAACDQIVGGGSVVNPVTLTPSPVGWPSPIPTAPTAPPTAPATCTSLGVSNVTFTKAAYPIAGDYCLGGAATLTIAVNANYSGYSFVASTINVTSTTSTFGPASGESTVFDATSGALTIATGNTITGAMCLGTASLSLVKANHPPGTYCLTGTTGTLTPGGGLGTNWSGYSWFAPYISTSSNSKTYTPATGQTTLFDAYQGDLSLSGSSNNATGNMFAANGQAAVSGGGVGAGSGFIEANTISFSGNFASFTGTGVFPAQTSTSPVTTIQGTTNAGTSTPGTTNAGTSTPGTTNAGTSTPGSTSTGTTNPGTSISGTTTDGSTQTSTTGTNIGLGE